MFFLSRGKPNPSPSFPSREKIIVRTINKQTISNIFFFILDGSAVLGLFGFRRKTKNKLKELIAL